MARPKRTVIQEGPEAAERFARTVRRVLSVSKEELTKREAAYQEASRSKVRRGPKPTKK